MSQHSLMCCHMIALPLTMRGFHASSCSARAKSCLVLSICPFQTGKADRKVPREIHVSNISGASRLEISQTSSHPLSSL